MGNILEIIDLLLALKLLSEETHLLSTSYSDHLLAEKIQEDLDESIDALKEISIYCLGAMEVASAKRSFKAANSYLEKVEQSDSIEQRFSYLKEIIDKCLSYCATFETKKDIGLQTIVGDISRDLARKGYLLKQRLQNER